MLKELLADGERALVIAQRRRGARGPPRRAAARPTPCAPATRCCSTPRRLRLRADPEVRGRGARPRRGPGHRLRRRSAAWSARSTQIRDAVELPYLHPELFKEHQLQAAQGRAALRPSRLRQDADRQGGRQLAGQEGRGEAPARRGSPTSSTSRAPSCSTSTSARPSGTSGWSSSGPARRPADGTPVIVFFDEMDSLFRTRGSGRLLRRREHHRPAAAQRDRRRRGAGERHRHRRLQPRGHDRPGDPAARPARREDQDRAPRRRVARATSSASTSPPTCRCTPTTWPSTAATATRASRR